MDIKDFNELLSAIKQANQSGDGPYLRRPIPDSVDLKVSELVHRFQDADQKLKEELLLMIDEELSQILLVYAERMSSQSVRSFDEVALRKGFMSLFVEDFRVDRRESLMTLAVLYDAALRLKKDFKALIEEMRVHISKTAYDEIMNFILRDEEGKSLASAGYRFINGSRNLLYERSSS
jgi:hypothetical protein